MVLDLPNNGQKPGPVQLLLCDTGFVLKQHLKGHLCAWARCAEGWLLHVETRPAHAHLDARSIVRGVYIPQSILRAFSTFRHP